MFKKLSIICESKTQDELDEKVLALRREIDRLYPNIPFFVTIEKDHFLIDFVGNTTKMADSLIALCEKYNAKVLSKHFYIEELDNISNLRFIDFTRDEISSFVITGSVTEENYKQLSDVGLGNIDLMLIYNAKEDDNVEILTSKTINWLLEYASKHKIQNFNVGQCEFVDLAEYRPLNNVSCRIVPVKVANDNTNKFKIAHDNFVKTKNVNQWIDDLMEMGLEDWI